MGIASRDFEARSKKNKKTVRLNWDLIVEMLYTIDDTIDDSYYDNADEAFDIGKNMNIMLMETASKLNDYGEMLNAKAWHI